MAVQVSLPAAAPLPSLPVTPVITRPQISVGKNLKKQEAALQALPLSPKNAGLLAGLGLASFYWVTSIRRLNWMALLTFLGAAGLGVALGAYKKDAYNTPRLTGENPVSDPPAELPQPEVPQPAKLSKLA